MTQAQPRRTWDGLDIAADQPAGATIVVRRKGVAGQHEFLLLHRNGEGPDYEGDWAWTAPAGCRQPGEAVYPAALRELAEEAGLIGPCPWAVDLSWQRPTGTSWVVFAVDVPAHTHIDLVDPEHDRYIWASASTARRLVRPRFVAESQVDKLKCVPGVTLSFRPMTLDDLPNLLKWRRQPHVARWWHRGAVTLESAKQRYGSRISGDDPTRMWSVNVNGRDVGYTQAYQVSDYADYADATGEADAVAFDYLIGDPAPIGKGLGTRMIWEFLRDVLVPEYSSSPRFLASPDHRNTASLRALDKCGFTRGADIVVPSDDGGEPATEVVCTLDRKHWFG
jgi:aminoglycoside 6'-N-acetyltransferase